MSRYSLPHVRLGPAVLGDDTKPTNTRIGHYDVRQVRVWNYEIVKRPGATYIRVTNGSIELHLMDDSFEICVVTVSKTTESVRLLSFGYKIRGSSFGTLSRLPEREIRPEQTKKSRRNIYI